MFIGNCKRKDCSQSIFSQEVKHEIHDSLVHIVCLLSNSPIYSLWSLRTAVLPLTSTQQDCPLEPSGKTTKKQAYPSLWFFDRKKLFWALPDPGFLQEMISSINSMSNVEIALMIFSFATTIFETNQLHQSNINTKKNQDVQILRLIFFGNSQLRKIFYAEIH